MLKLIFTVLVALTTAAGAQVLAPADDGLPGLQVNGCGAKNGIKVPDQLLGCQLRVPCDNHDLCYSKCLEGGKDFTAPHCQYMRCQSGGDLVGKPICEGDSFKELAVQARARRAICDEGLLTEIKVTNVSNPLCGAVAGSYYTAVHLGGGRHFNGYEIQDLMRSINNLTEDKSAAQLKQLELQGFDGNAPIHKELKLAVTPLPDIQQLQQKDILTKFPQLDKDWLRRQILNDDKVLGPGSGGGYQGGMSSGAGAGK